MMNGEELSVKLSDIIAPKYREIYWAIKNNEIDEAWLYGGRGTTKSSFVPIIKVLSLVTHPNTHGIAFRKTGNTVRHSIHQSILWAIELLNFGQFFAPITSPSEITFIPTGQKILLKGLDDPRKLKSIRLNFGYFRTVWFEEVDEFSSLEEVRNVRQSVMRGGEDILSFYTFNPPKNKKHWANIEVAREKPRKIAKYSTYLDVPRHWLGEKFFEEAEDLRQNDPVAYQHEYLGKAVGNPEEIVFAGYYEVKEFDMPELEDLYQKRFFYGGDWGDVDPNVLVRCFIKDKNLYVDYENFDKEYKDIRGQWKLRGESTPLENMADFYDKVPQSRRWNIYADSARPETIKYVRRQGFRIYSVKKTTKNAKTEEKGTKEGYVMDGIAYLKGAFRKIIIHPRCKNLIVEFENYRYKVDKETKEILPTLEDKFNHGIDALRYAISEYIRRKPSLFD